MGRYQRQKGIRGELLWRDECHKHGFFGVQRHGQQMYQRGSEQADCDGLPHLHQEVKFVESLNYRKAFAQASRDCRAGEKPILASKVSRGEWLVTIRSSDFFEFYLAWLLYGGRKDNPSPTGRKD